MNVSGKAHARRAAPHAHLRKVPWLDANKRNRHLIFRPGGMGDIKDDGHGGDECTQWASQYSSSGPGKPPISTRRGELSLNWRDRELNLLAGKIYWQDGSSLFLPFLIICRWKYHDEKVWGVGVQGAAAQVTEGSRCAGARDVPTRATRRACVLGRRAFLRLNPRPVGCKAVLCGSGCTRAACALVACVFRRTQAPYRGHSHRPSDQPRRKLRARPPNHPFGV